MSVKDVTIVAVSTYAHELTKKSIERTLSSLDCKEVLVLSDQNLFPDGRWIKINPITIEDYNTIMFKHLWPFVSTEHILVVQFDGMAVNPQFWDDDFLNYDYIGAVWPWPHHPPGYKVGNGGFSLRSRRLINTLKDKFFVDHKDLKPYEDLYIGVHFKDELVSRGIKIADDETAKRFSHEHFPQKSNSFGFHGVFNVPYYLNEDEATEFITLMPTWSNEASALLIPHCFRAKKKELGHLAIATGRRKSKGFDERIRQILKTVPELRRDREAIIELLKAMGSLK